MKLGHARFAMLAAAAFVLVAAVMFSVQRLHDASRMPQQRETPIGSERSTGPGRDQTTAPEEGSQRPLDPAADGDPTQRQRDAMVAGQLRARDITNDFVLKAMARVPRHEFVPDWSRDRAYGDHPLSIGLDQTISQPYVVALMTQLAEVSRGSRVLDVGTGSGYQAAVLAEIVDKVLSIEILCELADKARERLASLGYDNITVRCGDGYQGWPEEAPFDAIIVAAAPDHVPQPLVDQLAPGGRMVLPVGRGDQQLLVIEKSQDGTVRRRTVAPVMFVPMTGEAQRRGDGRP